MTNQELDAIVNAVVPFRGPLVLPVITLVGEYRYAMKRLERAEALLEAMISAEVETEEGLTLDQKKVEDTITEIRAFLFRPR